MTQTIQWNAKVTVGGNTQLALSRSISVEAVDTIKVTVRGTATPGGPDTDMEVEVQPGAAGQVKFLAISSDRFGNDTNFLSYKVNADTNPAFRLDQPVVLAGTGAVSALDSAPARLFFSSTIAQDTMIHIVVGRDATPSP